MPGTGVDRVEDIPAVLREGAPLKSVVVTNDPWLQSTLNHSGRVPNSEGLAHVVSDPMPEPDAIRHAEEMKRRYPVSEFGVTLAALVE